MSHILWKNKKCSKPPTRWDVTNIQTNLRGNTTMHHVIIITALPQDRHPSVIKHGNGQFPIDTIPTKTFICMEFPSHVLIAGGYRTDVVLNRKGTGNRRKDAPKYPQVYVCWFMLSHPIVDNLYDAPCFQQFLELYPLVI